MKNHRILGLGLALGLGLTLSSVGFTQNQTPTSHAVKTEVCCAMDSCCKGESCSMKDHAKKEHATKQHTKIDAASADKHACCCSGDSCDMKTKHQTQKSHAGQKGSCCNGDSCSMTHEMKEHGKDQMKKDHSGMHQGMKAVMHGDKEGCCCCSGDSCEMKMTHEQQKAKA